MDAAGNVFVTGYSASSATTDFYTAKYAAADGALLWEKRYIGGVAYGLAVDPDGNVVVGGIAAGFTQGSNVFHVVKYAAGDGAILWEATYDPGPDHILRMLQPPNPHVYGRKIALLPNGGAVIGGSVEYMGNIDYFTMAFWPPQPLMPIDIWKINHLGGVAASDLGDPDKDGIVTLVEYGLNTLPAKPDAAPFAITRTAYPEGERLRIFLQRDPGHNDVTLEVQAGETMVGPWTTVATSTLGAPFTGPGYVGGDDATPGVKTVEIRDVMNITESASRFLRVKVIR